MIQVHATDEPGDLPENLFGTAEGCVAKKADVLSSGVFNCPPL